MLFSPQSAQASKIIPTMNPVQVSLVSPQPTHNMTTSFTAIATPQESDPIRDYLSCGCSQCVKAGLELQGKLPIGNHF